MTVRKIDENTIVVQSLIEGQFSEELAEAHELSTGKGDFDVIIDFSEIEIINSSHISSLILLRKALHDIGRELILYNLSFVTHSVFALAGLDTFFLFAKNKKSAIEALEKHHISH